MPSPANLPRNLASIFAGQVLTWASSATFFFVVPRYLGPEGTGIISIGLTYAGLVMLVGGLGMATLITREVARSVEEAGKWLAVGIAIQAILAVLAAVLAVSAALVTGAQGSTVLAVAIYCFSAPALLVSLTVVAVLQGLERMSVAAAYDVLTRASGLVLVLIVIFFDGGLYAVVFAMNGGTLLIAVVHYMHLRRLVPLKWNAFSVPRALSLARSSVPFFIVTVFFVLYTSTDILMLSVLAGERDAGIYAAPMRIFGTMLFVPAAIATVVFPRLSATAHGDAGAFHRLAGTSMLYAASATGGVVLIAAAMSDDAIVALLGEGFAQTGPVILALSAALLPTAVSTVAARVAFANDRQRLMSVIGACAFVVNVVLAFIFIPVFDARWGNPALGAALGLVAVEWVMSIAMLFFLPRSIWTGDLVRRGLAFAGSLVVCMAVLLVMLPGFGGWIAALVSTSAYALCLLATGVHRPAELISFLRRALERRQAPVLNT
ncbi:MAG: flippase [Dehalococcoidia bacterium]|nr:flippase [Dehalococcoidia bacterium]